MIKYKWQLILKCFINDIMDEVVKEERKFVKITGEILRDLDEKMVYKNTV